MDRKIERDLLEWKVAPNRLVMLLRGARQVGKTYSIRRLGDTFKHFCEINFEEQVRAKVFFEGDFDVHRICEKLSAYSHMPVIPGETLLFFDEVQACPNCLRALRFFREKLPQLHVVAAGSLLEFVLSEMPSFGVGRITSLFMYPMTYMEFLRAQGADALADFLEKNPLGIPIDVPLHEQLLEYWRTYLLLGGMPAVVDEYGRRHDLLECSRVAESLLQTILDDFSKHAGRVDPQLARDVLRSASRQAGGKFKYSAVGEGASAYEVKRTLSMLERAGLLHFVYHTGAGGIPLGALTNEKKFKVLPADIGMHQRLLGLDLSEQLVLSHAELINRGSSAEVFVGLEIIAGQLAYRRPALYYWHREQPDSNAEVDYVIQRSDRIYPVEVKSGTKGGMQSMRIFLSERKLPLGLRLSQENASRYQDVLSLPLYVAGSLPTAKEL